MPASDKHVLDYTGLEYFKTKLYSDLKTINGTAITGGGNLPLVTLDTDQVITGTKTVTRINFGSDQSSIRVDSLGRITINPLGTTARLVVGDANTYVNNHLSALTDGTRDLGSSSYKWRDLYVSRYLKDGTNSIAIEKIESVDNKVTSLTSLSTDTQYPSAKATYDALSTKYVKPQGGIPASDLAETYLLASAKGASNGVASLDSNSKIPLSQIPEAILGASEQGGVITYSNNTMTISLNQNGAALLGTTAGNKTWSELAALLYAKQTEGTGLYFIFENDVASYDFAINSVSNVITDIQVGDWVIYNGGTDIRKIENVDAVKSVQILGTSPVVSSNATAQNGIVVTTISLADAYGDTKNPYGSKTANYILAAPNGSAGAPSFRALVSDDIPALAISKITNLQTTLNSKYVKPADGIPDADLEQTYTKQSDFTVSGSTLILEWL